MTRQPKKAAAKVPPTSAPRRKPKPPEQPTEQPRVFAIPGDLAQAALDYIANCHPPDGVPVSYALNLINGFGSLEVIPDASPAETGDLGTTNNLSTR